MLIAFEVERNDGELVEWEMEIDPTYQEIVWFYGKYVEDWEDDEEFAEWLKIRYSGIAQDDYYDAMEE